MDIRSVRILLLSYMLIALLGALLLSLPPMQITPLPFVDLLFTSTSAVCVTGLIVQNTASDFTFWGQLVILLLIQVGGFGYMTLATLLYLVLRRRLGFREKQVLKETLDYPTMDGLIRFMRRIVFFVLYIEFVGALLLFGRFSLDKEMEEALWLAIFHAVSAFNNAGFSLFESNLMEYRGDVAINLVITSLIIIGGLGYFVLLELREHHKKRFFHLSLHTKVVVAMTAALLVFAALVVLILEWNNPRTLGELPVWERFMAAYFASVNFRTAGFNTLDIGGFRDATMFFSSIFMSIGGAPGGTAGGIKVTTVAVLLLYGWASLRQGEPVIFKRKVADEVVQKSFVILLGAAIYIILSTMALSMIEEGVSFLPLLLEVSSAFGTVGLSAGDGGVLSLSANFDTFGKFFMIVLMLLGRVGVLAFTIVFFGASSPRRVQYPEGRIIL